MLAQNAKLSFASRAEALMCQLAALYGIERCYRDVWGKWRQASASTVMRVLATLGAEVSGFDWDGWEPSRSKAGSREERLLEKALRTRESEATRRLVEPVYVAWRGKLTLAVHQTAWSRLGAPDGWVYFALSLEEGGEVTKAVRVSTLVSGKPVHLCWDLPLGYHRLAVEGAGLSEVALVISAPPTCWPPGLSRETGRLVSDKTRPEEDAAQTQLFGPGWGVFAPVYALPSLGRRNQAGNNEGVAWVGLGDLGDLAELRRLVGRLGGSVVATLPLLGLLRDGIPAGVSRGSRAAGRGSEGETVDFVFDPSPYRPSSRLFFDELYLAVDRTPEWKECTCLRKTWESGLQAQAAKLAEGSLVDYAEVAALKRRLITTASRCFFEHSEGSRRESLAAYLGAHPEAERYAQFCADHGSLCQQGQGRRDEIVRSYLYAQWQLDEQLNGTSCGDSHIRDARVVGLMLDLPVGVHPRGFDVWRWPELFARDMSIGAPPDLFFEEGQNWACPPLQPEAMRRDGYAYLASCLRHHMQHSTHLRVDHIMWLHRAYWIPEGKPAAEGVYVTYPTDELYAVLCLESWRHRTVVVGEDLGTVGRGVRARLRRHGVLGTWVLQGALRPRAARAVRPAPPHSVALLGTHDMFPFAGYVEGKDISVRIESGRVGAATARRALAARRRLLARLAHDLCAGPSESLGASPGTGTGDLRGTQALPETTTLLRLVLSFLGQSDAPLVLVGLRDLLLESEPENIPGTGPERSNWRRRLQASPEQIEAALVEAAALLRRSGAPGPLLQCPANAS
ncbi:MAG: 4-alpha-glucanotransferase [Thermoleophilia bacterium]|nr:4-alpha-glucanotransferase [Thermoleophilia bacterium]